MSETPHPSRLQVVGDDSEGNAPLKGVEDLLGESITIQELRRLIARMSSLQENVLLLGETGAGKGLVARILHGMGPNREHPMVALDCAAIPSDLIESELFGHEKGSFTGADRSRKGLLELAEQGTLFLDEVSELPWHLQSKLLRALQEREFRSVGSSSLKRLLARVIAASNRDLHREMREGRFRDDLYYRLNVIPIAIPPLREHFEDIPLLAKAFLGRFRRENPAFPVGSISSGALEVLCRYSWPGNVRELENVIRRTAALAHGEVIQTDDLPEEILASGGLRAEDRSTGFFRAREKWLSGFEERYFRDVLGQTAGNVVEASRLSGVPRATLYRYLNKHSLDPSAFRDSRPRSRPKDETPA